MAGDGACESAPFFLLIALFNSSQVIAEGGIRLDFRLFCDCSIFSNTFTFGE
jgi:hypothetical protein